MVLNRESIKDGLLTQLAREGAAKGLIDPWTPEQRLQSRTEILARRPSGPIWVFGYGSLIWNPAFHYEQTEHATLFGYHRSFCLWTQLGRGSPENPGLMLGLERGGCCHGLAFRIHEDKVEEELDLVWAREMISGSYRPTWVKLRSGDETMHAITFVIQRNQPRYACNLSMEEAAQSIAKAHGQIGTCADYLLNTVDALERMEVPDRYLHKLRERVLAIQSQS